MMIFTSSRAFKALVATLAMAEALVDYLGGNQRCNKMKYPVSYIALKCLLCACEQVGIGQLCAITSICQLLATGWGGGLWWMKT